MVGINVDFDATSGGQLNHTTDLTIGPWFHVVAIYDGSNSYLYLDDVSVSEASTGTIANTSNPMAIGDNTAAGTREWDGIIEDIQEAELAEEKKPVSV